jgi:transcriptional regulator with XRE-family HTH domain
MFSDKLRQLRKEKGYTQKELSHIIGLSDNAVTNYEQGYRQPEQSILIKLASVLECSLDELVGNVVVESVKIELNDYGKQLGLTESEVKEALEFAAKMKKKR